MNATQLDLFSPPVFRIGQPVQCPIGRGRVYHVSPATATSPGAVWVEISNTARPYDLNQVSVLEEGGDRHAN